MLSLNAQCDSIWKWALSNIRNPYFKKSQRDPSSFLLCEDTAITWPSTKQEPGFQWTSNLGLATSKTMRNHFIVHKLPSPLPVYSILF